MVDRVRDFLRDENLGITIPIGFVVASAGLFVLRALIYAFVTPIIAQAIGRGPGNEMRFSIGDITFQYVTPLMDGIVFVVLLFVLYTLFYRPEEAEEAPESGIRECPECRSEIVIDATRCAFCTSAVTPLATPDTAQAP